MKRLGLLVIGDEILAGHTQDTNTHWLARRLRDAGIQLARVEVCSDDVEDIEASVRRFLHDLGLHYVITSGGLGPTHDDRTMEGIAKAVGVPLVLRDEDEAWIRERTAYGHRLGYFESAEPNPGLLKMALLPQGSESMPNGVGTCLGAAVRHKDVTLFTLPGVPKEFQRMFDESVLPRLDGDAAPHVEELVLYTEESRLYEVLRRLEDDHDVTIGSYPQRGHILIRATGTLDAARAAIEDLRSKAKRYLSR